MVLNREKLLHLTCWWLIDIKMYISLHIWFDIEVQIYLCIGLVVNVNNFRDVLILGCTH